MNGWKIGFWACLIFLVLSILATNFWYIAYNENLEITHNNGCIAACCLRGYSLSSVGDDGYCYCSADYGDTSGPILDDKFQEIER